MFKDISIKPFYNTYSDDVVEEFYNRALFHAREYDRVSAYFSAKALALYANGISEIYRNNGKIKFIISKYISEEDFEQLVLGYTNREKLEQELLKSLEEELSEQEKKRIANVAFLIERNVMDVKIAFVKEGIFHDKFGILYDDSNNKIYFRGSNNETYSAIKSNYESFEVSCDWNNNKFENEKIKNAEILFEKLWNNEEKNIAVIPIPEVVKEELLKFHQNKLFDENEILYDRFVYIDLNRNGEAYLKASENTFDKCDTFYQVYLNRFIKLDSYGNYNLFGINNYIDLKKAIERIKKYSEKKDFVLIISNRVKEFLKNKDMQIEERIKIGIDIKNREEYLKESFNEFCLLLKKEMHRELREPQLWNAFHITKLWKSANYSVPGSGKTSIVYGVFAFLNSYEINKVDKLVMIGPKNSFFAWKDEFNKNFGLKKELKVLDIQNSEYSTVNKKINILRNESGTKNLILINYELLPALENVLKEILTERVLLVFDEIHKIKGIDGIRAKAALNIAGNVKYKVALTGTPIPNGYQDIYNSLKILYTDEYDNIFNFKPNYLKNAGIIESKKINQKLYPFYCRITKKDLKIPEPREDIIVSSEMNLDEQIIFEHIYKRYKKNILALYIRLMQASTNPELLKKNLDLQDFEGVFSKGTEDSLEIQEQFENVYNNIDINEISDSEIVKIIERNKISSKFKKGINIVKKIVNEGKQVLVWGIFVDTLNKIKRELKLMGISCEIIDGQVSYEDREIRLDDFKKGKFKVLIANPNTLAESVSLHKCCHDAIYFEYSFNLTHMVQSKDRINRLGLTDEEYTQYYFMNLNSPNERYNAIDKKIYLRLKEKERVMTDAIEGTELRRINFDDADDLKLIINED